MALISNSNTECWKFYKEFKDFYLKTVLLVRSIRKLHHGQLEELKKISEASSREKMKRVIIPRHELSFKKLIVVLEYYSDNFYYMRSRYEDIFSCKSKHIEYQVVQVERIYRLLCYQRDVILLGIHSIIEIHLEDASKYFIGFEPYLERQSIFKLIGIFNTLIVKLQRIPHFKSEENVKKESPSAFTNSRHQQLVPNSLSQRSQKLKRITASNILQLIGKSRVCLVSEKIVKSLICLIKPKKGQNEALLPWKPIFYDPATCPPHVDIFAEAIAKEEDEYARNQRKLDMALKLEFGENFPAVDYSHLQVSIHSDENVATNTRKIDNLIKSNSRLFHILIRKFVHTSGILVPTMTKRKEGKIRLVKAAKNRLESYFIEKLWGPSTEIVDEMVLWFPFTEFSKPMAPIALLPHAQMFQFLDQIRLYCDQGLLSESCENSCQNIVDECRHVAIMTFMDQAFCKGFGPYSRQNPGMAKMTDSSNYCTEGGENLVNAAEMLTYQINEMEKPEPEAESREWPIAEEIGFMHCFVVLLGAVNSLCKSRGSYLLHTWNTAQYFLVTQSDLPRVIDKAKKLNIKERDNLIKTDDSNRLQLALYREKMVVIVEKIVEFSKLLEQETVKDVSNMCRTVSLAHLQNSMPETRVWKGIARPPLRTHKYVYQYIGAVLEPVMNAVSRLGSHLQRRAGSTMLKVVCYSWLEHIKAQKITFSHWGAQQLLKDFHALAQWLKQYPGLESEARTQILAVDVLRECEGVARLLMRQPGDAAHNQIAPSGLLRTGGRKAEKEFHLGAEDDDIPAEMYVPNQQQWLNLRAKSQSKFFTNFAACCSWQNTGSR